MIGAAILARLPWGAILRVGAGVALAIGAVLWLRATIADARSDERGKVSAEYQAAEQRATIADLQSALADAKRRASITETKNAELEEGLASGRVELAAYIDRLRRSFNQGGTGGASGVSTTGAAGGTGAADQETLMDDLAICGENTERLINGKAWYEEQRGK
jgi:hypothetical protein